MKKTICILLLLVLILTGCTGRKPPAQRGNSGTTAANIQMELGTFAYRDGFIYFTDHINAIYEYEIETGRTVTLLSGSDVPTYLSLHVVEDHILYSTLSEAKIGRLTRDGKKHDVFLELNTTCPYFFLDGADIYILEPIQKHLLIHRNLDTGEETVIAEEVIWFEVDDTYLYIIVKPDDTSSLLRAPRGTCQFEKIELSFNPSKVVAAGDVLYLSPFYYENFDASPTRYANGQEEKLPITTGSYQILDHFLIYAEDTGPGGFALLKTYDLETGETTQLCDSLLQFAVLEQRYICFRGDGQYKIYDWQTGETVTMLG